MKTPSRARVRLFTPLLASLGTTLSCSGGSDRRPEAPPNDAAATRVRCDGSEREATAQAIPTAFQWLSTEPLVSPIANEAHPILSVKDPSVVYYGDRWHVFATTADENAQWSMVYVTFRDWSQAAKSTQYYLNDYPNLTGYHAAPQVLFFGPQNKWYLIFQSPQPQYSTTDDISRPETWTRPVNFFGAEPQIVRDNKGSGGWLDFWLICDDVNCHLFFTDDNGHLYRSQTALGDFPAGFAEPVIALEATREALFEGGATYRVAGTGKYLTLVEAFGPQGGRYYRSFTADTLDGEWLPLADSWTNPFASMNNVTFESGTAWTEEVSHGELVRSGYDQTLTVSLADACLLYQGMDPTHSGVEYFRRPYRLALLGQRE